jgi:hypothetical protein
MLMEMAVFSFPALPTVAFYLNAIYAPLVFIGFVPLIVRIERSCFLLFTAFAGFHLYSQNSQTMN